MPALDMLGLAPTNDSAEHTPAANTAAVATLPAKAGYQWLITGYTMSTDGNVAAAITPTVVSGALKIDKFKAPAALPVDRVVEFSRGVLCPVNTDVVATLPAPGAGVIGSVTLRGRLVQA